MLTQHSCTFAKSSSGSLPTRSDGLPAELEEATTQLLPMLSSRLPFAESCFFQGDTVPKPPLIKDAACEPIDDGACEPVEDATSICPGLVTDLVPALAEHSFRDAPSNHLLVKFAVDKYLWSRSFLVKKEPWLGEFVMGL